MNTILAAIVHCFVGCNAGSDDQQALHVLECDTETGMAKIVQSVKGIQGTTYFQADDSHLYSMVFDKRGERKVGSIVRFALDGWHIGAMERLIELPCEAPCHVSLTPDGRRVAFAVYTSGIGGSVSIDGNDLKIFRFPDDEMGPNKLRQEKAYAHCTFYTPDKTRLGVVDLGCDRIWFFDPKTMIRDEGLSIKADKGDGPRHAIWSKDGRFLFVLNELGSSVASYSFDGKGFARVGKWSMLPKDHNRWEKDGQTLNTKAAAIKLTDDGKILMASNRGHDSIAFYAVDGGELKVRNIAKLEGSFPRDYELMPGEKFMVVGHKMSNEIRVYRFDRENCTLTAIGEPIAVWHPLCFKFR